jgi:hypothetical protein
MCELQRQKYYFLTYISTEIETCTGTCKAGFLVSLYLIFVHVVRLGYECMTYHTLSDSHYLKVYYMNNDISVFVNGIKLICQ